MTELTSENFRGKVLEYEGKVLIDFWAEWCGPCRMLSPVIDEISKENPEFNIGKVNVDEQPELAAAFGIESIPTLLLLESGRVVDKSVGVIPKEQIMAMLLK